jgi:hypothetical protein
MAAMFVAGASILMINFASLGEGIPVNRAGQPERVFRLCSAILRLDGLYVLLALCLAAPQLAVSQAIETTATPNNTLAMNVATTETDAPAQVTIGTARKPRDRPLVESEIAVTGMVPFGDVRMYSATVRCNAWTIAVEYDRHSFGHLLGARVDYVAEMIPFMLLSQPAVSDFWGNAKSPYQELVPGVSISPIGFRFLWFNGKRVRPFLTGKTGIAAFTKKAMSPNASYANSNTQGEMGVEIRVSDRVDLRLVPIMLFHVSNAYLAASNPGMDELASKFGVSFHLGKRRE